MADHVHLADLCIQAGDRALVRSVGLDLEAGEIVGLVGASGSGKTLTARSLLGLHGPNPGVVSADLLIESGSEIHRPYDGLSQTHGSRERRKQLRKTELRFQSIRGRIIGYLAQDGRSSLDPLFSVGRQVQEALDLGSTGGTPASWLTRAGFEHPDTVIPLFPHELSGGMAQRVSIALALARGSRFIIADEPTTGLDPTVQEEILAEIRDTAAEGVGFLLITHDLRLLPPLASRVIILHEGRVVESLDAHDLQHARSPEGRALIQATNRIGGHVL